MRLVAATRNRRKKIMTTRKQLFAAAVAALICLSGASMMAQDNNPPPGPGPGPGGPGRQGRGNFDPAQFRQRMMDNLKEQLEVTDDTEWTSLQPLIQKVMDARMASFGGMGRGMMGRPRGGDNTADPAARRGPFGQPNPDAEALQRAIDGKASNAEMKSAIAKFVEARKAKQTELEKAQGDLRKVLSVRQEAIATVNGLL
jgi:hypothetical protein